MNVCIAVRDRPPLDSPDPRRAPAAQQAAAFASFFSYAGRYLVRDGVVEHRVEVALDPALVGTRQMRRIDLRGEALELVADGSGPGGDRRHRLSWRRRAPDQDREPNSGSSHHG